MPNDDYATALNAYRDLVALHAGVELKGKKMPYTSLNGHMTSFLDPEGALCLRLSKSDMANFLAGYPGPPVEQYGAVMKEYVRVPASLLADVSVLSGWFQRSRDYVASLNPKPTKR